MAEDGILGGREDMDGLRPGTPHRLDPRAILTSIGEVVYDWDISSDVLNWGANAAEVLGLQDAAPISTGKAFGLLVAPESGSSRHDVILAAQGRDPGCGVPYRTRYDICLPDGRTLGIEDTGRWYAGPKSRPALAHGVIRVDAGEAVAPAARNRAAFIAQIASDIRETRHSQRRVTMVIAAIENLDRINDELGYEGGEAVIEEVLQRLRKVMRRRDCFSRYAGNRFAIAMMSCPREQAAYAAGRLAEAVTEKPVQTPQGPLPIALRIGAACAPDHAEDAPALMRRAEDALAQARRSPGSGCVIFDPASARKLGPRGGAGVTSPDIIDALNQRHVVFARQPVIEAASRRYGFGEALARIARPGRPLIPGGVLVPVVERAGLVSLLDARMLELATRWLAAHPQDRLSVNLSPMTLARSDWLPTLAGHLGAHQGVSERLIIEVTETIAVDDPGRARSRLEAMKALGVGIAIDDFGAGHTSFRHLREFPIDMIKIDGAFVQNLSRSPDDRFFVRTLIDLARHLGIATVAEWVEDEETALMLAEWGIDFLQGDHCGRPEILQDGESGAIAHDGAVENPLAV